MHMNTHVAPPKPFTWSYSQLKNFETCERRNQQIDRLKQFKEDSEQLRWGNFLHDSFAKSIKNGVPLPGSMKNYEQFVAVITKRRDRFTIETERKLAFDRDFQPTTYFDAKTWFRGVIDVSMIQPKLAVLIDWKSGKVVDDRVQLGLFATMIFAHYPEVEKVVSSYIWLANDATTDETWTRDDMPNLWAALMPRVKRMEDAYKNNSYQPNPSGLCRKYCPVTTCEYHGVGGY
jgi:hypothetical protein